MKGFTHAGCVVSAKAPPELQGLTTPSTKQREEEVDSMRASVTASVRVCVGLLRAANRNHGDRRGHDQKFERCLENTDFSRVVVGARPNAARLQQWQTWSL